MVIKTTKDESLALQELIKVVDPDKLIVEKKESLIFCNLLVKRKEIPVGIISHIKICSRINFSFTSGWTVGRGSGRRTNQLSKGSKH